ncbi:hypothetical protein [Apilactobacillus ozensis]|uniref:hypothetical protein n=1 Tax=Apilactobacillus ozensis TaxID=866801 RepID=UPI00200AD641|nr:hypothetical protein [Apilactobacillus ozensis]MCK8607248.1 hypothetical protein [Apilactobacillus ozensis]
MKHTKYILLFFTSFLCLLCISNNADAHVKYVKTPVSLRGTWIGKGITINKAGA